MHTTSPRALALPVIAFAMLLPGCGDDEGGTATRDTLEQTTADVRQEGEDALASLRVDAERLIDQIQTRNAPEVKQELLTQCRNIEERLRRADSEDAGRVDRVCNRIRDTDPANTDVWNEIKDEIQKLRAG